MQRLCAAHAVLLQWLCSGCAALTQHGGVLHEQHEGVAQSGADGFGARKEEVEGRQLQVLHRELRVRVVLLLGGGRWGKTGVGEVAKGAELLWGLQKGQQNCFGGCKRGRVCKGDGCRIALGVAKAMSCFGGCKRCRVCKGDGCRVALGAAKGAAELPEGLQKRSVALGVAKGAGFAKAMVAELLWGLQKGQNCFGGCKGVGWLWGLQRRWLQSCIGCCKDAELLWGSQRRLVAELLWGS